MKNLDTVDTMLENLLKENKDKIKAITPKNPTIKTNDEWRAENHWDALYKELAAK